MRKRQLLTGPAAVALFTMLSLLASLAGMEVGLNRNVVLAGVSLLVVTVVARHVVPSRERATAQSSG